MNDVFKSIFGERLTLLIWANLEVKFFIGCLEVARKPDMFSKSLEKLFGSVAAKNLERYILRRLCQILKVELELGDDVNFSDCVSRLRNVYMQILAVKYKPLIMKG
ncbi:MAG: hypothetical protein QXQ47_01985 [Candidatus Bathyarchaeia archaeon]